MKNITVTKLLSSLLVIIILFSQFSNGIKLLDQELLDYASKAHLDKTDLNSKNKIIAKVSTDSNKSKLKSQTYDNIDDINEDDINLSDDDLGDDDEEPGDLSAGDVNQASNSLIEQVERKQIEDDKNKELQAKKKTLKKVVKKKGRNASMNSDNEFDKDDTDGKSCEEIKKYGKQREFCEKKFLIKEVK